MEINNYGETNTYIFEIDVNGWGFYICYGKHGHGYFIAIPNWGVCVEAAEYDNIEYNAGRLSACLDKTVAANAEEIADGIHKYMLWYKETDKKQKAVRITLLYNRDGIAGIINNELIKQGGNDDE